MDLLTSIEGWSRVGGRRITFVATFVELQALLEDSLHGREGSSC